MSPPVSDPTTIAVLVAAQRDGATTAEALAATRIAAIRADDIIRAVVELDADGALATARALDDARASGAPLGPLHGVPMTLKTSFAAVGLTASVGTPGSRVRATEDAPAVARLRAAGAVLLGTTNVPPDLDGFFSDSPLGGRTANPWDPTRTPGGSSGGAAAAIAAGWSWGDIGSDLGGSIRVPAAFCGVPALRPSQYTVSKRGHLPWPVDAWTEPPLSAAGPMARSMADVATVFEVLRRDDPEATTTAPATITDLRGLRVGVWRDEPGATCDPEVDAVLDGFLADLAAAGCVLVPVRRTVLGTSASADLFDRLFDLELAFTGDGGVPVGRAWADWDAQRALRAAWAAEVAHVDVVIAPAVPVVAPPHGAVQKDAILRARIGRWSAMANLVGAPCAILPVGLDPVHGLPVAAQVIAPFAHDRDALAVALLLERTGIAAPLLPRLPSSTMPPEARL
jgi:amidase